MREDNRNMDDICTHTAINTHTSTAQHSIAQHSTAQHSTAQHDAHLQFEQMCSDGRMKHGSATMCFVRGDDSSVAKELPTHMYTAET